MKFKPLDPADYLAAMDCPTGYWWVGHPQCESPGDDEHLLINRRNELEFLSGVSDPDADYSYDEYALVMLDGVLYLCHTSGCSCPSPTETWGVIGKGCYSDCMTALAGHADDDQWVLDWLQDWKGIILEAFDERGKD